MSHNDFKRGETIEPQEASPVKQTISVLGLDIAKRVFHAVGLDAMGKIVLRVDVEEWVDWIGREINTCVGQQFDEIVHLAKPSFTKNGL